MSAAPSGSICSQKRDIVSSARHVSLSLMSWLPLCAHLLRVVRSSLSHVRQSFESFLRNTSFHCISAKSRQSAMSSESTSVSKSPVSGRLRFWSS